MAKQLLLGIDFGGSSSKATLLESSGRIVASSTREYPSYFPYSGWYEQDADELFDALVFNVRAILRDSGVDSAEICGVCVDAATHMAVLCGEDDRPLRRFLHWSDCRSGKEAAALKAQYGDLLTAHTVNSVSAAWTLPHLLWLRENEPEVLEKTKRIYFLKDYLRHRLTGDFCTDSVEAMGAILADDHSGTWCPALCAIAGIDVSMLPEIKAATDLAGHITEDAARLTGLRAGTPVIVGAPDTALEVFASGAVAEGMATVKLATAGRICPITDRPIPSFQFFNYRHVVPGLWYPGTGTRSCAASYKWYRDTLGTAEAAEAAARGESAYELLNRAAEQVPPGCEGLIFHPYLLGEMTPYFNDDLCASFTGIRASHGKGAFTRAVMEGVAYSMRDCLEEIRAQDIRVEQYRLIGGGAKGRLWRQILSDVLAMPLTCTMDNDSSLGSAMLAGVALGVFDSYRDSVEKCVVVSDQVTPIAANIPIYEKGFQRYRKIVRALSEIYSET